MATTIGGVSGLTPGIQSNLLALSRTQNLIDNVQQRLATGKRVSSALDGANNFFLSSSLSAQASRLNGVLDNIINRVSTIEQADNSVSSLQNLVQEAQGVADQAVEVFASTTLEAKVTGNRTLTNFADLPGDVAGIDNNDRLIFAFVDTNGTVNTLNTVTINNGESINDIINEINAFTDAGASQVFQASLNSSGQLEIKTQDNTRFEIEFQASAGGADTQLAAALGFGGFDISEVDNGVAETRITVESTPSLTTVSLFEIGGTVAQASTSLINITDTAGGLARDIFDGDSGDAINIGINDETTVTVVSDISTATLQTLIDGINNSGSLKDRIEAKFDSGAATLNIRATDPDVVSIQIEIDEDAAGPAGRAAKIDLQQLGIGAQVLQSALDGNNTVSSESLLLNSNASTLVNLETEFNSFRTQIDELVSDAELNNINLLNGDDLVTLLNEGGTSSLVTEGGNLGAQSLGVNEADFGTSSNAATSADETQDALDEIEFFASALQNDLVVIEARQAFTEETINNLNASANDLTAADENEEGALLLALQTRQALGVTGLALGAQSQQSSLRLF